MPWATCLMLRDNIIILIYYKTARGGHVYCRGRICNLPMASAGSDAYKYKYLNDGRRHACGLKLSCL
ncbi:hypothetical protein FWK35_00000450 [Aphis craccivora]|uniref:Uncharacterized protein n=1 Tax=Aphis craccivora TaxID=307492 RepID=A0A6G0ZG95_APHCR|nr:hypothetical protein FWK35_00000450 [Aphis craccivora]